MLFFSAIVVSPFQSTAEIVMPHLRQINEIRARRRHREGKRLVGVLEIASFRRVDGKESCVVYGLMECSRK